MTHFDEMLTIADGRAAQILRMQVTDPRQERCGAFVNLDGGTDTRFSGFQLAHLVCVYVIPASRYYHSEQVKTALQAAFAYLQRCQRPGGCLDLSACNFDSAPDTAFTINAVISSWQLFVRDPGEGAEWLREPMLRLIGSCAEGVMNGGFHTPNHRWAIAACLKHAAAICGRPDFSEKADVYLGEGLDIDENGEFAERSTGTYNLVNDDQMIRLYLATGDRTYLEAARSNLLMMRTYIDPDGSVFTNNSTRQDNGRKVYLENYYILYLLTGYLLGDEDLAAYSEYCWQTAAAHGQIPRGIEWLALYPELEAFGKRRQPDLSAVEHYRRLFPASRIGRIRSGDLSCTVMAGRPNFLYFQHGANVLHLAVYGNVCEKRNFVPQTLEETENGFRVSARMDSWYYLPFNGDGPLTRDWWAMDNANTRQKQIRDALTVTVDVAMAGDGADVRIRTEGLTGVPMRLEWAFLPGCQLRNENFVLQTAAGGSMTVCGGTLQASDASEDVLTLGPAFAEHDVHNRMGGAWPLSGDHFTVFCTAYTPFERVIHIGGKPVFERIIQGILEKEG